MPEPTVETVEAYVRRQLSAALGGGRGVFESAVPSIAFVISWMTTSDLRRSILTGLVGAIVLLIARLVQRSNPQYVLISLFGIGIGALFASRSGEARGYFEPGLWINSGSAALLILSVVLGWPLVGFIVGSLSDDPVAWKQDRGLVKLCSALTLILAAPNLLRLAVQLPLFLANEVELLGTARVVMGWPLQLGALAVMAWLLSRNAIPLDARSALAADDESQDDTP